MFVIGLMSGTSVDGVDAVLIEFTGNLNHPKWDLINLSSLDYSFDLRKKIFDLGQGGKCSSQEWLELSEAITYVHAEAARRCDPKGIASIVGCHGQTVFHRPASSLQRGGSLQLIQGALLAKMINKSVIYDFRSKDIAFGGHGAPLIPCLDEALLGRINGWRVVLNIGGISNLTILPPSSGPDKHLNVVGWDCGPGNTLIDIAVNKATNGAMLFDKDGLLASKGQIDFPAIKKWLQEPFFNSLPPKSSGREQFGIEDFNRRCDQLSSAVNEDVIATMTNFTAQIIFQEIQKLYVQKSIRPVELLIAGGGSNNPVLVGEIRRLCQGIRVFSIDELGIPTKSREPMAFALLAWWNILSKPVDFSFITGACQPLILGVKVDPF